MGVLIIFIIMFGIIVSISASIIAYMCGSDAREKEVRWSSLYGSDSYNNRFVAPFNYIYDAGYAAYDKRTQRARRNRENFKRK